MSGGWVLLGYGPFARRVLEVSIAEGWPPVAVMTHGEESDLDRVSVADVANDHALAVTTLNPNEEGYDWLVSKRPEVLFTVNYRRILDPHVLELTPGLGFNIHGSLLPTLRGRAPLTWALIQGLEKTGVTVHLLEPEVDTGDIAEQVEIRIGSTDTVKTLQKRMLDLYPVLVERVIRKVREGGLVVRPQTGTATYGQRRTPDDGEIDWRWGATEIYNWVRALTRPYPGAFTRLGSSRLLIWRVSIVELSIQLATPGQVVGPHVSVSGGASWAVACTEGLVGIEEMEPRTPSLAAGVILPG